MIEPFKNINRLLCQFGKIEILHVKNSRFLDFFHENSAYFHIAESRKTFFNIETPSIFSIYEANINVTVY